MSAHSTLDWPEGVDRTPPGDRESGSQFDVSYSRTRTQLRKEMDRLDAERWNLDEVNGANEPGIVLRWTKEDDDTGEMVDYALACDGYTSKKANLREVYLWVNETRMRSQRKASTSRDEFAAAALPGQTAEPTGPPPHEVLSVAPDAPDPVVESAARGLKAHYHPDSGEEPDREAFKRVQRAEQEMIDG